MVKLSSNSIMQSARTKPGIDVDLLPQSVKCNITTGKSCLVSYNTFERDISLPFTLYSNISFSKMEKKILLNLKLHCALPINKSVSNFVGELCLPHSCVNVSASSSLASIKFNHDKIRNMYFFETAHFPGDAHHSITLKLLVSEWSPALKLELSRIVLRFEVPMFCQSNLKIVDFQVKNLPVFSESNLDDKIEKWVRYLTYSNSYEFYLSDHWIPIDHDR